MKLLFILLYLLLPHQIFAIELISNQDWRLHFAGTIDPILSFDSTRSFRDTTDSAPVARAGTYSGEEGRSQLSIRTSRFGFILALPERNLVTQRAILAFDFLGYTPSPSTIEPTISELNFYNNPALRLTLAYYSIEKEGWRLIAGQAGSLFGWIPFYSPTLMGLRPISGINIAHPTQFTLFKSFSTQIKEKVQTGISINRPIQSDSEMPNVDLGLRYVFGTNKAAFNNAANEIVLEQASIALSSTFRKFEIPKSPSNVDSQTFKGVAYDINVLVPILTQDDDQIQNTIVLVGNTSFGDGYSEVFSGVNFNLPQLSFLDAGLGGYDNSGNFRLAQLQAWSAQLQYHLPTETKSFVSVSFGQLKLKNADGFISANGSNIYDTSKTICTNFFYDFTKNIRAGIEYRNITTNYIDGIEANNDRVSLNTMFRF